jgi:7,8-dihydropterin-6-yl-methyl-4-(beta-D-ribofuranosyl)aminobenzene 5'-phosphate synthase
MKSYSYTHLLPLLLLCSCLLAHQAPVQIKHAPPSKMDGDDQRGLTTTNEPSPESNSSALTIKWKAIESTANPKENQMELNPAKITVLYDNNPYNRRLKTAWGFSALIEYGSSVILFDTGGDSPRLMSNMTDLGFDPASVEAVVLSHSHNDHVGGLEGFLKQANEPAIYVLPSFSPKFKELLCNKTATFEVTPGLSIIEGVISTGELGSDIPEQALVLKTVQGLVVITGCAHPGIVEILRTSKDLGGDNVHLVLGGFHLKETDQSTIAKIITDFKRLGVEKVAPAHCTGSEAIAMFKEAYGKDFIPIGVGRKIEVGE